MTAQHVTPITAQSPAELPAKDDSDFDYQPTPAGIAADNRRKATFAAQAVKAYAETTGLSNDDIATAVGDLLGDLRHLLDCLNAADADADEALDFDVLAERGYRYYASETRTGVAF